MSLTKRIFMLAAVIGAFAITYAGASAASTKKTLRFVSVSTKQVSVPGGFIVSDVDRSNSGNVIGSDTLNCRAGSACVVAINFNGGAALFLSTRLEGKVIHGAVVGGLGRYKGATGTVTGRGQNKTALTITLAG